MINANFVIILLLILNLCATVFFGSQQNTVSHASSKETVQHNLPEFVTKKSREIMLNDFKEHFNNKDYDALYEMFGSVAKAEISKDQIVGAFVKLADSFGKIKNGAFEYSEYSGSTGNTKVYFLYYRVMLTEDSQFGNSAKLKITIGVNEDEYQIYGIHLNSTI